MTRTAPIWIFSVARAMTRAWSKNFPRNSSEHGDRRPQSRFVIDQNQGGGGNSAPLHSQPPTPIMTAPTIKDFFKHLPGKFDAEAADDLEAVYQFDLSG